MVDLAKEGEVNFPEWTDYRNKNGLDPLGIKTLRDLIVRLNKQFGTTIFMNTHLLSEVSKTCTSIAVLNQGKLVFHDTLKGVLAKFGDDTALEQLYLSMAPKVAA